MAEHDHPAGQIHIEQRGWVLLARLDGPPHGELGPAIADDLAALVTRAETDAGVGDVVLTGTHPERFVAHADVRWLQEWDPTFIANVSRDGILLYTSGSLPAPFAA